jgi:adenosylcobinamide-GDP ribazoletransferase
VNALRLAFGLLTALPVGSPPRVDRRTAGRAMLLAPLTTVPLLGGLLAAHALVAAGAPAFVVAALVVAGGVLVTRALHVDGLADTADGLSAGYDPASSLRAMKASDTGPSGVAAVVLALLLDTAALAVLLPTPAGTTLAVVAWATSRLALALGCRRGLPPAQPGGLGALVAGTVGPAGLALAGAVAVGLAALPPVVAVLVPGATGSGAMPWVGALVVTAGLGAAAALLARCRARLGGVTGDVLGASVEVALVAALSTAALAAGLGGATG